MPERSVDLDSSYKLLNLSSNASLEDLDRAYFQLKTEMISQKQRQDLPRLKQAYQTIKFYLQTRSTAQEIGSSPLSLDCNHDDIATNDARIYIARELRSLFLVQGWNVQVHLSRRQLQLQLIESRGAKVAHPHLEKHSSATITQIHTWLKNNASRLSGLSHLQTVKISAHRHSTHILWTHTIPMPGAESTFADHDLTSFHSRLVQMFAFPGLLLLAIGMNIVEPLKFLLRGITIWFHEFGHATIAWLSGRKAIPLPFGWTNIEPNRSLFVYLGILILLGLMGRAGYREKRRWPIVLAIAFAILQFGMTWMMPSQMFEMLFFFGGIGGEFYLCTLLIVSFFFPLPNYFRWDIYRYPAVLGAAFTFWGSFSLWQQIDQGQQLIPWGSLWGGADHQGGDMNQLSHVYGWSDQQIIDTYNALGGICLSVIIGVYLYFVWKNQRSHLLLFWHQIRSSYWK